MRWDGETTTFSNLPEDSNKASLVGTEPPLPKKFHDAYENVKNEDLKETKVNDEVFETPRPNTDPLDIDAVPFDVNDEEEDPIFDNAELEPISESLKDL